MKTTKVYCNTCWGSGYHPHPQDTNLLVLCGDCKHQGYIEQELCSVSDVEQLQKQHVSDTQRLLSEIQKELKDKVNGIIMSELSRDRIQNRIDEVFNNFKGK